MLKNAEEISSNGYLLKNKIHSAEQSFWLHTVCARILYLSRYISISDKRLKRRRHVASGKFVVIAYLQYAYSVQDSGTFTFDSISDGKNVVIKTFGSGHK